jgi:hypothetical protein
MAVCPACGTEVGESASECSGCHLAVSLFPAVREAAGPSEGKPPAYLRTVAELLASVDLEAPPETEPITGLVSHPPRFPALPVAEVAPPKSQRSAEALGPLREVPALPSMGPVESDRRRLGEYFQLGRRLALDFTDFERRAHDAESSKDPASVEIVLREMFVHLASALAEEYDLALTRRNELADLVPTHGADVQFEAIRGALGSGDLVGAQRRLAQVRDELSQTEEEWQVGRVLVTECDLLAITLRDLGGDPAPAAGPLEEGRRLIGAGHRAEGERVLAGAAIAIWSLLEPKLIEDLRRLRDQLVEARSTGVDVGPAVAELRTLATELRQRNFVGTIVAYRHVRSFVDRTTSPEGNGAGGGAARASASSGPIDPTYR